MTKIQELLDRVESGDITAAEADAEANAGGAVTFSVSVPTTEKPNLKRGFKVGGFGRRPLATPYANQLVRMLNHAPKALAEVLKHSDTDADGYWASRSDEEREATVKLATSICEAFQAAGIDGETIV